MAKRPDYISFILPRPPSVNAQTRNATAKDGKSKGRIKTKEYNAWIEEARWKIAAMNLPKIDAPRYGAGYTIPAVNRIRRDIANLEKALSDILVTAGIIPNDCFLDHVETRRYYPMDKEDEELWKDTVHVEVWPINNPRQDGRF